MAHLFTKKRLLFLSFAGVLLVAAVYVGKLIPIGAAYKAKILCSGMFISHRDPAEILQQELYGPTGIMQVRRAFLDQPRHRGCEALPETAA